MTKDEVEMIIKRFKFIEKAVNAGKDCAVFYVGNRKFTIPITESVITVCDIIRDVYSRIKDVWLKALVDGILSDKSDIFLIMQLPWEKNAYYKRKDDFFNTVFLGCAAKGLISYEEILDDVS